MQSKLKHGKTDIHITEEFNNENRCKDNPKESIGDIDVNCRIRKEINMNLNKIMREDTMLLNGIVNNNTKSLNSRTHMVLTIIYMQTTRHRKKYILTTIYHKRNKRANMPNSNHDGVRREEWIYQVWYRKPKCTLIGKFRRFLIFSFFVIVFIRSRTFLAVKYMIRQHKFSKYYFIFFKQHYYFISTHEYKSNC